VTCNLKEDLCDGVNNPITTYI